MLVMIIITVITTLRKYDICEGGIAFYETRSFSFSYESPSASEASCERPVESAPSGGHEGGFDPVRRPWQERAKPLLQSRLPSPPLSGGLMARSSPETRQLSFNFSAFLAANWPCQMARPPMFVYPDDDGGDAGCALIDGFLRAGDGGCHCHCFFPYFFPILFLLFSSRGAAVSSVSPPGFASFDPRFVRDPKLLFRAAVARSHPPRVLKRRQI